MFEAIEKFAPNAVFSMFTGDVIERQVWNSSIQTNKKQLHRAYGNMSNYFDLVYPVMGNHDSSPVNVYPYTEAPSALDTQWLYNTVADEWKRWTGGSSSDDIHFLGHYSSKFPHGNLRIISLNTNFYYRANFWMYRDPLVHDPKDQLTWLVAQLDAAEKATENVYIIGHMPMGDKDVFRHHSNYFDQIVRRYRSTIAAMFFGHTHVDQFEVSYTDYQNRTADNAMAISYIAPSLTPSDGMPSFRIYDVDPETFAVLDATTYITDMNDPSYDRGPTWKKYYSAKEAYGSLLSPPVTDTEAELSPAFWHRVTEELESDDSAFKAYFERKRRGWNDISCDVVCKKEEICQLRAGRTEDNCQVDKPGFHISKRRDGGTPESARGSPHHCGDSHTAGILAALVDPNHRDTVIKLLEAELSMLD
ncbi:Sphingomyelin phosphodiesterase [Beauveria bassiana]|nr:Sphingomyelin phosphodiesterase [Beauveria bassiana]